MTALVWAIRCGPHRIPLGLVDLCTSAATGVPVAYTWLRIQAKIPDETASKPEDWDEDAPQQIEDAAASKPSGWLDDGELVRPVTHSVAANTESHFVSPVKQAHAHWRLAR